MTRRTYVDQDGCRFTRVAAEVDEIEYQAVANALESRTTTSLIRDLFTYFIYHDPKAYQEYTRLKQSEPVVPKNGRFVLGPTPEDVAREELRQLQKKWWPPFDYETFEKRLAAGMTPEEAEKGLDGEQA